MEATHETLADGGYDYDDGYDEFEDDDWIEWADREAAFESRMRG